MSSVRMCDVPVQGRRCGRVFSELDDDWSTGSVNVMRRNKETGRREEVSENQDRCPEHSAGIVTAITAGYGGGPDYSKIAELETADLDWRVRQAERQADEQYQTWLKDQEASQAHSPGD